MNIIDKFKTLKTVSNSNYYDFKYKFNYHSNKMDGSTFSIHEVLELQEHRLVCGTHKMDDVFETKNSLDAYDFLTDTLKEPFSLGLLIKLDKILKKNTKNDDIKLENLTEIDKIVEWWNRVENKTLIIITEFHFRFQNSNVWGSYAGRISRFIMLKQCIEANIDPILINSGNINEYNVSLMQNTSQDLYNFICSCKQYKL